MNTKKLHELKLMIEVLHGLGMRPQLRFEPEAEREIGEYLKTTFCEILQEEIGEPEPETEDKTE